MITAKQDRSRATEDRILEAAETLLAGQPFDELSVTDIAATAGVSVGGLYARFEGKDGLLHALHRRYEDRRTDRMSAALDEERLRGLDAAGRTRAVVTAIVDLMREERHVLRTFLLRYWSRPEEVTPAFAERLGSIYDRAAGILLQGRDRMTVADPDEAARAAIAIVMGTCRDTLVMKGESQPGHPRLSRDALIDHLTAAALAVVGIPDSEAPPS